MTIYRFGGNPESEFQTGVLKGFNQDSLSSADYETERAQKLYAAIEASPSDLEYVLGVLPDERWALIGLTLPGHIFAIED